MSHFLHTLAATGLCEEVLSDYGHYMVKDAPASVFHLCMHFNFLKTF